MLFRSSITGNVISVAKGTAGKVYTTAEVDAKLKKFLTYQGVIDMFGEGKMLEVEGPESILDCVHVCHQNAMQCAFGEIFIYADDIFKGYPPEWISHNLACEDSVQDIQFYEIFNSSEKLLRCLCLPIPKYVLGSPR